MTGALISKTALHSAMFSGTIENKPCKNGVYSSAKCNTMLSVMAYTSTMLSHNGRVSRDSLDERAFIAFSISITTRIESEMVEAALALSLANISQPILGNVEEHW